MFVAVESAAAFSASYDQKITRGEDVFVSKVTILDEMFRIEAAMGGETSVTLRNRDGIYTYLPSAGVAMKLPPNAQSPRPMEHTENYPAYLKEQQAERIGADTINGYPCAVYRFTNPATNEMTKVWVWKEREFPVKIELKGGSGTMVIELTNIQLGGVVPESTFQLPPGIQAVDVGSPMGVPQPQH